MIPVPKDAGKPDGLKLFLLDKSWIHLNDSVKWAEYHDKELEFKSSHRPSLRRVRALRHQHSADGNGDGISLD